MVPQTLHQYLLGELRNHPEQYELILMMADTLTISSASGNTNLLVTSSGGSYSL